MLTSASNRHHRENDHESNRPVLRIAWNEDWPPRGDVFGDHLSTGPQQRLILFFFAKWMLRFLSQRPHSQVSLTEERCTARLSNVRTLPKEPTPFCGRFLVFSNTRALYIVILVATLSAPGSFSAGFMPERA